MNSEQRALQTKCLTLMWGFSENKHDRQLVLKYGGLEWVTDALLLDTHKSMDGHEIRQTTDIHESAVGCLNQHMEFPQIQEAIAKNREAVDKVIHMVQSTSEMKPHGGVYRLYCSQLAASTLFRCASNLTTPSILVDNKVHLKLLKLTQSFLEDDTHDMPLGYYCCLFLARIRSSPLVTLNSVVARDIDTVIRQFMSLHGPNDIAEWEDAHRYVWVSVLPFVSIAFAGGCCGPEEELRAVHFGSHGERRGREENAPEAQRNASGSDRVCDEAHPVALGENTQRIEGEGSHRRTAAKVKGKRTHREMDQPNSCVKGGQPEPTCQSDRTGETQALGASVVANPHLVLGAKKTDVEGTPSWPGSPEMQRFGVFTLKSMLQSNENVQLLQSEGLLPYTVCLTWQLPQTERELLTDELRKLGQVNAPSLEVISKSVLARMNGLETMYKI